MSTYSEFFLRSSSSVVMLELIELSHPSWSNTYRLVRNAINGVSVTTEEGVVEYTYCPMKIDFGGHSDDLDQHYTILLGDVGEIIAPEFERMVAADTILIKPKVVHRVYRSDDLVNVLYPPVRLDIQDFTFNRDGCSIKATAPSLNILQTGLEYTTDSFPMLASFL